MIMAGSSLMQDKLAFGLLRGRQRNATGALEASAGHLATAPRTTKGWSAQGPGFAQLLSCRQVQALVCSSRFTAAWSRAESFGSLDESTSCIASGGAG